MKLQNRNLNLCVVLILAFALPALAQQASVQTFKISPLKPVAELRREALAATPPVEKGPFRNPDLVELVKLDPTIKLDIRYATTNNFMGTPFYQQARAFLQRPAAEAVARVNAKLKPLGYGLIIHDGYRPWYVTKMFWDGTPADKHQYVADPQEGSRHSRGCAVDLSLYDLNTGEEVEMPSGYDEMSPRAHADYAGGTPEERQRRDLLRRLMESEGFQVYPFEWWHFDYENWSQYPILNLSFDQIRPVESSPGRVGGTGATAYRVGGGVSAPRAIYAPDPKYPKAARRAQQEGTVVLWVVVGADGLPHEVRVARAMGMDFDEAAVKAVRKWRFEPARLNGQPVPVQINVEVNFRIAR